MFPQIPTDPTLKDLSQAIKNMTVVLEGLNTQFYLLREEMVHNRLTQADEVDNDLVFKAHVAEELARLLEER